MPIQGQEGHTCSVHPDWDAGHPLCRVPPHGLAPTPTPTPGSTLCSGGQGLLVEFRVLTLHPLPGQTKRWDAKVPMPQPVSVGGCKGREAA